MLAVLTRKTSNEEKIQPTSPGPGWEYAGQGKQGGNHWRRTNRQPIKSPDPQNPPAVVDAIQKIRKIIDDPKLLEGNQDEQTKAVASILEGLSTDQIGRIKKEMGIEVGSGTKRNIIDKVAEKIIGKENSSRLLQQEHKEPEPSSKLTGKPIGEKPSTPDWNKLQAKPDRWRPPDPRRVAGSRLMSTEGVPVPGRSEPKPEPSPAKPIWGTEPAWERPPGELGIVINPDRPWVVERNGKPIAKYSHNVTKEELAKLSHRIAVYDALKAGDDVPADVLAKYPDLQQRFGPGKTQEPARAKEVMVEPPNRPPEVKRELKEPPPFPVQEGTPGLKTAQSLADRVLAGTATTPEIYEQVNNLRNLSPQQFDSIVRSVLGISKADILGPLNEHNYDQPLKPLPGVLAAVRDRLVVQRDWNKANEFKSIGVDGFTRKVTEYHGTHPPKGFTKFLGVGPRGGEIWTIGDSDKTAEITYTTMDKLVQQGDKVADKIFDAGEATMQAAGAAGRKMSEITGKLFGKLEQRYGKPAAISIFAAANVASWSASGIGAAFGVPVMVPGQTLLAAVPFIAIAETYKQLRWSSGSGSTKKSFTFKDSTYHGPNPPEGFDKLIGHGPKGGEIWGRSGEEKPHHAQTKEKRGKPGSQLPPDTGEKMKALGMVGSLPPADVPADKIKIADLSRGKEALKFEALMSWDQNTKSGRVSRQYRYTQEFHDRNAAEKHERVAAIKPHIDAVQKTLESKMTDKNLPERTREAAAIANVIRETGLRPTDSDESVKHGHFGISSIQARHCTINGNEIMLEFTGKEGVLNKSVIRDPANVAFIKEALKKSKGEDFVFREANSNNAGDALKEAYSDAGGSGDIKIKDLRTLKAHQIAEKAVAEFQGPPPPLTGDKKKDGKLVAKAILEMATKVSNVLNNKPEESRDTYVAPEIWKSWQQKLSAAV